MQFASAITVSAFLAVAQSATAGVSTLRERSLSGEATYYGGNIVGGACSFASYTLPTGLYGTALSSDNWDTSANCGRCAKVTGPSGNSIDVLIVDECPNCGTNHLDLFPDAFAALAEPSKGVIDVTWDYIDCPQTSDLWVKLKEGVSAYWFSIMVVNANKGVASVTVSADGGSTWLSTTRMDYNYFQISSGTGTTTVSVKITSIDGDVVTISGVSVVAGATKTGSNFPLTSSGSISTSAALLASSVLQSTSSTLAPVASISSASTSVASTSEVSTSAAAQQQVSTNVAIVLPTTASLVSTVNLATSQAAASSGAEPATAIFSSSVSIATFPPLTTASESISVPAVTVVLSTATVIPVAASSSISALIPATSQAVTTIRTTLADLTTIHVTTAHIHTTTVLAPVPIVTKTATAVVEVTQITTVGAQASGSSSQKPHSRGGHRASSRRQRKSRDLCASAKPTSAAASTTAESAATSSDVDSASSTEGVIASVIATHLGAIASTSSIADSSDAEETEIASASSAPTSVVASVVASHRLGVSTSATPQATTFATPSSSGKSAASALGLIATSTGILIDTSALPTDVASASSTELAPGVSVIYSYITTCVPTTIYSTIPLVVISKPTTVSAKPSTTPIVVANGTTTGVPAQFTGAASSLSLSVSAWVGVIGLIGFALL